MTGPGASWADEPARWTAPAGFRAPEPLGAEQRPEPQRVTCRHRGHSDGPHWAQTYPGPQACVDPQPADVEPVKGRSRRRGVRRVGRESTMAAETVERVERLAELEHGGNYSAALERVVEAGLATMDAAAQLRAAAASGDLLGVDGATRRMMDAAGAGDAGHALAVAEVDQLVRSGLCPRCGQREAEHHGDTCPPPL